MLYHGSKNLLAKLEPRKSYEKKDWVYATTDYCYALKRAGNFDIRKPLIREDFDEVTGKHTLAECVPGAFEQVFNRPGYVYIVDETNFRHNFWTEYVSEKEVKIEMAIYIENVWQEILKHEDKFEIHYYGDEEYWSNVKGGLDGYLKRKRKIIEQLEA